MKLENLLEEFISGTTIQKEEHFKKFVGFEVLILGFINNIADNSISLIQFSYYSYSLGGFWTYPEDYHHNIQIYFEKDKFEKALLNFSLNDEVKILAKLKNANFLHQNQFTFELVSIEIISSFEEKKKKDEVEKLQEQLRNENEERRKRRNDYAGSGALIGATILGLTGLVSCLSNGGQGGFNFISGVLIGAVIGALIGVVFAKQ